MSLHSRYINTPLRVPLKAVRVQRTNEPWNTHTDDMEEYLKRHLGELNTPLTRVKWRSRLVDQAKEKLPEKFKLLPNDPVNTAEDIRLHFPVRGFSSNNDSDINTDIGFEAQFGKKPKYTKRSRYSDYIKPSGFNEELPSDRRHSMLESAWPTIQPDPQCKLAPVCPVPIPAAFETQPKLYTSMLRTVETQTSPLGAENPVSSKIPIRKRPRRRSTSTQVLDTLRKTFGSLKRVMSAERLNKFSTTPELLRSETTRDDGSRMTQTPRYELRKKRASLQPDLMSDTQIISEPMSPEAASVNFQNTPALIADTRCSEEVEDWLTCQIIETFKDGSLKVSLRRSSTAQQFGFFIARDKQGIYVSRLGSVKCAVKLWDALHVGDRLLSVQGVSCSQLGVDEVQNLIRGCELAEFHVKPSRSTNLNSTQACQS